MDADLCCRTLTDTARMLRRREISPVELTRAVLARIERLDPPLHSYITITADRALDHAQKAERELSAGTDRGPLHGVPIAVKDLMFIRGVRTTCASRVLDDFVPYYDATVVERLEAAGAVILGKLNLTEFAMSGYARSLPIPLNPWDKTRSPGGSSSGSGVATAVGLCFASLGTDTGGSIRGPSAWCGVVGLKPTYGRVSRYGVFPLGMTLDHVGPMTRSVADAAAMLDVMAGRDPHDPTSLDAPAPQCSAALTRGVRGVRIGVDEHFARDFSHPDVSAALFAALEVLKQQGAELIAVSLPDVGELLEEWFVICAAEAVVGHAATYPSRADAYGPSFRSFLDYGAGLRAQDYARAHVRRVEFARRFQAIFEAADVFACPGMFMQAPPADAVDPYGPITPALAPFLRYTAPFNFSGNPTLSVPAGFSDDGLPHGIQLVGPLLGEAALCQVGHAYEQATQWHHRRPPIG
ncbi:MAG: amidase [Deltaproteobacteria bacterium]|nr:amidase [Deltaproteobacteria bacterium]